MYHVPSPTVLTHSGCIRCRRTEGTSAQKDAQRRQAGLSRGRARTVALQSGSVASSGNRQGTTPLPRVNRPPGYRVKPPRWRADGRRYRVTADSPRVAQSVKAFVSYPKNVSLLTITCLARCRAASPFASVRDCRFRNLMNQDFVPGGRKRDSPGGGRRGLPAACFASVSRTDTAGSAGCSAIRRAVAASSRRRSRRRSSARPAFTFSFLVPKLCFGTHLPEALLPADSCLGPDAPWRRRSGASGTARCEAGASQRDGKSSARRTT